MYTELSLYNLLIRRMASQKPGTVIFPNDFLEMGDYRAILMTLSRLANQGFLTRLGKGVYLKPKKDPIVGTVLPSLEEIAHAVAEKEKVIIRPTGAYAMNRLGLSTQVPTKVVFLTNGSRRRIQVGKGVITFKPTTPKNLAAKNEIVYLAIQSLITLGEKNITEKVKKKLAEKLRHIPPSEIREDARNAPQFASKIILDIANKIVHYD